MKTKKSIVCGFLAVMFALTLVFTGCGSLISILNTDEQSGRTASGTANSGSPAQETQFKFTLINGGTAYSVSKGTEINGAVVIPASYNDLPIIVIGTFANTSITSVTIPSSVTSIEDWAFYKCTDLTSITIPSSVTSIGNYAFSDCTNLTGITIPSSVTSIGNGAFSDCTSLTSVTIPSSVTSIGELAFDDCTSLTNVTIQLGVTSIGQSAFGGCTSLTSVTIPSSVTSIGSFAFQNCTSLTSITIPVGVTSIGGGAFQRCTSFTSITIPASVTYIGEGAFGYWKNTQTIYVQGKANQASADRAWGNKWRTEMIMERNYYLGDRNIDARIVYQQ